MMMMMMMMMICFLDNFFLILACQKLKEILEQLDEFEELIQSLNETKPGELLCPHW